MVFHKNELENTLFHKSWSEPCRLDLKPLIFYSCSPLQSVNQTFSEATIVNLTKKVVLIKFGQMSPFPPSEPGLFVRHLNSSYLNRWVETQCSSPEKCYKFKYIVNNVFTILK